MTPERFDEIRANAESRADLLSPADVIECLDEIARLTALVSSEKRDWRVGLPCKVKYRSHPRYYERGVIVAVHPNGFAEINDETGVLVIKMGAGDVIVSGADQWISA